MQKTFLFAVSCIFKIEENIISYKGAGNGKWNLGVAGGDKGEKVEVSEQAKPRRTVIPVNWGLDIPIRFMLEVPLAPFLLARPSRLPRAPNPLSFPFQTPTTQARWTGLSLLLSGHLTRKQTWHLPA